MESLSAVSKGQCFIVCKTYREMTYDSKGDKAKSKAKRTVIDILT